MKKTLLLSLMTVSLMTTAQSKGLIGVIDTYIIEKSGQVIDVASNEISENGMAKYYDYKTNKRKTIDLSELSKSTKKEIAGVKAGEYILLTTKVANSSELISRYCEVYNVFENSMAEVGCKTYAQDNEKKILETIRLDYIVKNVRSVIAEVESLNGVKKGEAMELRVDTPSAKVGRNVRVLVIFANGEALVQKIGFGLLDSSSILYKTSVDRVRVSDLSKI